MDFENIKINCQCNGKMERITTSWKGIEVKGWRCMKCNEELIHPIDAQKALEIDRARKNDELTVKLRKVGKSNVVTVPQTLMKIENLKAGQLLKWGIKGKTMTLTLSA